MSSIHVTNVKDASGNAALVTESGGVKTDKLTGITTAGSISVVGEGNSTTTNLQQGLIKCWCHFDSADSNNIEDSFNVASVTDNGTGNHTVVITNDMASALRKAVLFGMYNTTSPGSNEISSGGRGGPTISENNATLAAGSVRYEMWYGSDASNAGGNSDSSAGYIAVVGDLA